MLFFKDLTHFPVQDGLNIYFRNLGYIFKMTFLIHEWQMSSVAKNQRLNTKLKIHKTQY